VISAWLGLPVPVVEDAIAFLNHRLPEDLQVGAA
jgi:hypothetical protein